MKHSDDPVFFKALLLAGTILMFVLGWMLFRWPGLVIAFASWSVGVNFGVVGKDSRW